MKIESQDIDVQRLLSGNYFHIPRFQRPYSWDEDNINDFWTDVCTNKGADYFIGSMVVYKKSRQNLGIVDGQQRLTTITILLCAIRDEFDKLGSQDLAEGIQHLIERRNIDNQTAYVLKTETSYPYFHEYVQKFREEPESPPESSAEEKNIKSANLRFKYLIDATLNEINEKFQSPKKREAKKIQILQDMRDAILNLNVILISLEKEDDAYLIFETLNTRGKDLALTDLVKNHFTKHLRSNNAYDSTADKWGKMLETIRNSSSEISPDNYIQHFWASRHDSASPKNLFSKITKEITKSKAKEYLKYLIDDSIIYRSIHEAGYGWELNQQEVSKSLAALQMFRVSQPTPATLSLIRAFRTGILKYGKLRDALAMIEKFHFLFTAVTSSRGGGIANIYSSFARKLCETTSAHAASQEIINLSKKLKGKIPEYEDFRISFRKIQFTNVNSKDKNLVRYVLRKFAEHHHYKFAKDFEDLTIEHIFPQSKDAEPPWDLDSIGCIGNLIMLEGIHNEAIDTKSFKDKLRYFNSQKCDIPSYVKTATDWTPIIVYEHADHMARIAYDSIWKV